MAFSAELKNKPELYVQCTWAAVYMNPIVNKGILMRTYTRVLMSQLFGRFQYVTRKFRNYKVNQRMIGILTGNYTIDAKGVKWLEAYPIYCDRAEVHNNGIGWFRESDVWHAKKGTVPNPADWDFIPYKPATDPGTGSDQPGTPAKENKNSWLVWLTGGITLLKIFG